MNNFIFEQNNSIFINIKVTPSSKQNAILGLNGNYLKVSITTTAEKGKANQSLIKFLSKEFKIKQSDIEIVKGGTSHSKLIKLPFIPEKLKKL